MAEKMFVVLVILSVLSYVYAGAGTLQTINGTLMSVVDNCKVGVDSSCPSGHCCVKEGLAYIPEATGPKPAYQIACKPYRKHGEFCYRGTSHEFCPCDLTLKCNSSGFFGHCV